MILGYTGVLLEIIKLELCCFFCTIKRPYELCVLFNNQNVFGKIYFQSASKFKNEIALSIVHVWCGYHHAHIN